MMHDHLNVRLLKNVHSQVSFYFVIYFVSVMVACDESLWCVTDLGSNNSGYYRLQAVLTHRGRSSSSGHYVAWVHQKGDVWLKCDDDQVSPVTAEEVLKLSGGGKYCILGTFYFDGETSWKAQLKMWVSVKKDLWKLVVKMWTGLGAVVGFSLEWFCNEKFSSNPWFSVWIRKTT